MTTIDLIKWLKKAPETAEVCMDDAGGGLLPIGKPHMASAKEKATAGRNASDIILVIPAEIELGK